MQEHIQRLKVREKRRPHTQTRTQIRDLDALPVFNNGRQLRDYQVGLSLPISDWDRILAQDQRLQGNCTLRCRSLHESMLTVLLAQAWS